MKLSDIEKVINQKITFKDFRFLIKNEVSVYKTKFAETGRSIDIYCEEDLNCLIVGNKQMKNLLEGFLNNLINKIELLYLIDALSLSSKVKFENQYLKNEIELLSDSDYDENIDNDVRRVIKNIENLL